MSNTRLAKRAPRAVLAAFLALALPAAALAAENFHARLSPVPIDATTAAATKGTGTAAAELDGTKLKLSGSFSGLRGAATVARLHEGVATGVRGPAILEVAVPHEASGSFAVELTLTAAQAQGLRSGHVYLQIHSEAAPDGNLWGWLLQ